MSSSGNFNLTSGQSAYVVDDLRYMYCHCQALLLPLKVLLTLPVFYFGGGGGKNRNRIRSPGLDGIRSRNEIFFIEYYQQSTGTELTRVPPEYGNLVSYALSFIGGFHVGARALLVLNLIWFG
jgi:hypothetical protein